MKRTIEIIIGTTGEIQIDAVGFKGPDCEKATAFLEAALGVVGRKVKSLNITSTVPGPINRGLVDESTWSPVHEDGWASVVQPPALQNLLLRLF